MRTGWLTSDRDAMSCVLPGPCCFLARPRATRDTGWDAKVQLDPEAAGELTREGSLL